MHREFLAAGGLGILTGDGPLNYGFEKSLEVDYDFPVWKTLHAKLDYEFVANPAPNRDGGPASIIAGRVPWDF